MISFFPNYLEDTSITDVIQLYWNSLTSCLTDSFTILRNSHSKTLAKVVENFPENIYFDNFQWTLLKIFLALLITNLILIIVVWRIFGKSICERFMKLSTLREIEELKASVSKLKLPKEHTPF